MSKRLDGRTFGVTLDPGFKRLLKNEVAMVSFLNAILHSDDEIKKKYPSNDPKDIAEREKRCYEIPFVFAVWICNFPINSDKNYRDAWRDEWKALIVAVDGSITKYTLSNTGSSKLKSQTGWTAYSGITNEDAFGFSALPAGDRNYNGYYDDEGDYVYFWSSTENNSYNAYYMLLYYRLDDAYLFNDGRKNNGFSVRCVKDSD